MSNKKETKYVLIVALDNGEAKNVTSILQLNTSVGNQGVATIVYILQHRSDGQHIHRKTILRKMSL